LTDLPPEDRDGIKGFYSKVGDVCGLVLSHRAFVPHEHYDPIKFAHFTPKQVDRAERDQVCNKTSLVIAVYAAPSWGSGIEIEMAYRSGVPVIILCPEGKKVSRLLLGNPAVRQVFYYHSETQALEIVESFLRVGLAVKRKTAA
jgi:hypothetical protein